MKLINNNMITTNQRNQIKRQALAFQGRIVYQIQIDGQIVANCKTFANAMSYMSNRYKGQCIFGQGATIKQVLLNN